ncbi:MAG: VWA domain-containing protein [Thermoguttaceae bacterium]
MSSADTRLDAQLRQVPLPDGLMDRLMALPLAGDDGIDELLRDVAVPPGLSQQLQAAALAEDDALDEALRDVPLPEDLVASCRYYARPYLSRLKGRQARDRALRISRIAMAASLILAVTLSLGSAMLLSVALNGSSSQVAKHDPVPPAPPAVDEKPLESSWRMIADDSSGPGGSFGPGGRPSPLGDDKREIELAEIQPSGVLSSGDLAESATMPRGFDPMALPAGVLGYRPNNWDNLPDLPRRVADLVPHGLDWPLEKGANRPFLVLTGFHPFVSPAASERLQRCPVPLAIEPSSYELAQRYLERNEWPPIDRLRTEEFLAAVDYNFPKPKDQSLGLIVAGGPSPLRGEGFSLLQVGVQARQTDYARHAPLHLVLLIDTSTSMRWGSRIEIIRRALRDLPGIVDAEDRLSLVIFNQAAHVLVENLRRDASLPFAAAADSLSAEGATNIVAGLEQAYGVARSTLGPGQPAVRVVLLTDGLLDLEPATAEKIEQQAARAVGQNIPLDVIDLGQQKDVDPQVASLAREGRGTVHRAISAEQVRWALREIVTGRSQLVARAARLQVVFNPKSVLEYRLLGHESRDWDGLLPGPLEADFHEGQAATALFEVRLAPDGPNDLASAELTWYAPAGEKTLASKPTQTARTMIERKHFAASLTTSAASLQEAAVVAYAVEVLRHSPFIFQRQPGLTMPAALFRAVDLSGQVDSRLQLRPSFDEFVTLVRQEAKAHPAKRSVKD